MLGRLDDAVKEVHPQTDRERQLELQLTRLIQRLHSCTVLWMEKQKKLQDECRQADKKLELSQRRMNKERTEVILQNAETGKQKFSELQQHDRKEKYMIDEYREAYERFTGRELDNDVLARHDTAKKAQDDLSVSTEMLKANSELEISKYRNANENSIKFMMFKFLQLDAAVREADDRRQKLHDKLNVSDERKEKWERDLSESLERLSSCSDEVPQSVARQYQFQCLMLDRKTKVEQAWLAGNHAEWMVQNELALIQKQEQVITKDLSASSERIYMLRQETAQADTVQGWLKSTCDEDSGAHQLFQKASAECDILKKQLKQAQQSEDQLSQKLQQMQEKEKRLKGGLETMSERLHRTQDKVRLMGKRFDENDQISLIFEKEKKLQSHLEKACAREQQVQGEIERALSDEERLQQQLRQVCDEEESFRIQLTELQISRSGKCSMFYIVARNSARQTDQPFSYVFTCRRIARLLSMSVIFCLHPTEIFV